MTTPKPQDVPEAPAVIQHDHVQDRHLDKVGDRKGYRRLDGLAWLKAKKVINGSQLEAGRRLQEDYELSLMQASPRGGGERTSGGQGMDIPESAHAAGKRVKAALAVLPGELVSMTILFLLPDFKVAPFSLDRIAQSVGEDRRAIPLGVRVGLSLLARHYGR